MNQILTQIHGIPIRRNFVENLPYNPNLKFLLKDKRKAGILGEVLSGNRFVQDLFIILILIDKE
ncbi:hypothetical protein [Chryseobacterium paridis]|uniref:hypothetical protein n=1 Tax=Chryseobacterium paridis TaxID=2800328 RepID=UPI001F1F6F6A|nr:hypothetical protein [Chryseobacterium paridis]